MSSWAVLSTSPSASRALAGWSGSISTKWEIFWVTTAMASPVMGPPANSSIAGSRTSSDRGRPEAARNLGFSLRRMSHPVARTQGALTSPSRGTLTRSREPRDQGASRGIRAASLRARDWVLILQWERPVHDRGDNAVYRRAQLTLPARGSGPLVLCFRYNVAKEVTLPRRFSGATCGRPDHDSHRQRSPSGAAYIRRGSRRGCGAGRK